MTRTTTVAGSEASTAAGPAPAAGRYALGTREFEWLRALIYAEAGIALSPAKRVLLESRLSKRLRALDLESFEQYCTYLDEQRDDELVPFINCVTTNKTDFFREPHHFEFLRAQVLMAADARARQSGDRRLRVWSAGCSTGEEPYTIAMICRDWLKGRTGWDVRILASDIDTHVLAAAAAGEYDADRLADVPKEWRERWFPPAPGSGPGGAAGSGPGGVRDSVPGRTHGSAIGSAHRGALDGVLGSAIGGACMHRADQALRDLIAFRRINLNDERWPIQATFDVIFCRNVIIYFDRDTQARLLTRFARLLKPDGHLIIGHSESLAWLSDTFTPVRGVPTVYRLAAQARLGRPGTTAPPAGHTLAGHTLAAAHASSPGRHRPGEPAAAAPRTLAPGDVHVPGGTDILRAVTGASVLVALFDAEAACGGVALVSCDTAAVDGSSDRSGDGDRGAAVAGTLASLMLMLDARGAHAARLRAKVFGGATLRQDGDATRHANVCEAADAVRAFLASVNVPIVAERIGGETPLEILFHTDTGRALVREAPVAVWRAHAERGARGDA